MRREGCFIESRRSNKFVEKQFRDELSYAILKDEWDTHNEIAYYNSLPVIFNDFIDLPKLADNQIELVCVGMKPAIPEKKFVPAYDFEIRKEGQKIGGINLRIGYSDRLYFGGHIGYNIDEGNAGIAIRSGLASCLSPS